ncbi:hypothetical protein K4K51_012430 [Colletotrichum sp. SAR 10_75]|nr:hypothetical protein K4K51_012430 [Colletotrichum sp. SAR 10_75]
MLIYPNENNVWTMWDPDFDYQAYNFRDIEAVSEFGEAAQLGAQDFINELASGQIFPSVMNGQEASTLYANYFEGDNQITMMNLEGGVEESTAAELQEGAENLSEVLVEVGEEIVEFFAALVTTASEAKGDSKGKASKTRSKLLNKRVENPSAVIAASLAKGRAFRAKSERDIVMIRAGVATYSLTWLNGDPNASDVITVNDWRSSVSPFSHTTVSPDPVGTVFAFNHTENLGWYDNTFGGEPVSNGYIILNGPNGRFGVQIHVPARVFSIGTPPYYEVFYSNDGTAPVTWTNPVSDPSQRYTFPDSIGFSVTVQPLASDTTLSVTMLIKPLQSTQA